MWSYPCLAFSVKAIVELFIMAGKKLNKLFGYVESLLNMLEGMDYCKKKGHTVQRIWKPSEKHVFCV